MYSTARGTDMEQVARIHSVNSKQVMTLTKVEGGTARRRVLPLLPAPACSSVGSIIPPSPEASTALSVRFPGASEFLIRLLDITGAVAALILTLPVMVVAALLIKVTSPGPVLYKQERVGLGGRSFTLYKFRTMIKDAEKHTGPVWATKDDDRVTPVGRLLRRMSIDELPQIYNVLRGDMSLVGPRPERPFFVERHEVLQGVRLAVKPGLTGLAQVRSFYDLKPSHKVKYDLLYVQNRSVLLNFSILLQTIPVLFTKKGW